jgi:hypothetical protein
MLMKLNAGVVTCDNEDAVQTEKRSMFPTLAEGKLLTNEKKQL